MIVVKVGGSLFDLPDLGNRLSRFLDQLHEPILLVCGGGDFAEGVRKLDAIHKLGEERAHWLALRSLAISQAFLEGLLELDPHLGSRKITTLDCFAFCQENSEIPRSWDFTTDSIAATAAIRFGASCLILLKSLDIPARTTPLDAANRGWVDPYFPKILESASLGMSFVNLRTIAFSPVV